LARFGVLAARDPDRFACIMSVLADSKEGRPVEAALSKLSCRAGPVFVLEVEACLLDLRYDGR
jgi:hypothetical protein